MNYQIINKGMVFLNRLIESIEDLENKNLHLEVNAYDVPRTEDRYPYTEDDVVEDHPFGFIYIEEEFEIQCQYRGEFTMIATKTSDEKVIVRKKTFTTKETKETIKKCGKNYLQKLRQNSI